ncbi:MAG: DNA-binding protein [Candidatus Thorarchaeota archaeon]|nr:MAG: DNA-binding protein [Candidatus Thorarchaeota archaeon]
MSSDSWSEAKRWFLRASDELDDAKKLMTMRRYCLALYLSQQSAEKALKAFLYHRGVGPLLTYSVSNLVATASDLDRNFERISPAGRLDDYYIPTRYPNGLP